MIFLSEYDFVIKYRTGKRMGKPDAMTRRHELKEGSTAREQKPRILLPQSRFDPETTVASLVSREIDEAETETIQARILVEQGNDSFCQEILPFLYDPDLPRSEEMIKKLSGFSLTEDRILTFNQLIHVPESGNLRIEIMKQVHDTSGHFGEAKTFELLSRNYWWKKVREYVKDYIGSCDICQRNKVSRRKPGGLLNPLPIPTSPWKSISWDFIVDLPTSTAGNDSILVVVDRLTKEAHFIPCTKTITAPHLATLYLQEVYRYHGHVDDIVSDRGSVFTSKFWRTFTRLLGIQPNMSTAFHPQSDGQSEAINKVLEQYLRIHCNYQQDDWEFHLPLAEVAYNNSVSTSTKMTPWYANKGYHPRTASTFEPSSTKVKGTAQEALDVSENLKKIQEELKENLVKAQEDYKHFYDKKHRPVKFQVGDMVFLSAKNIKIQRPSKKLASQKLGPYKIEKLIGQGDNKVAAKLILPKSMRIHPVFHFSLLELKGTSRIPNRTNPPPPPVMVEGEEELEVKEILSSKIEYGKLYYLVRWEGYPESEDSWETPANVKNASELVSEYHERYPDKDSPETLAVWKAKQKTRKKRSRPLKAGSRRSPRGARS
jgi:Integrase zinc binding domain/Chromo (CHRromatin Organisation MOdifier) domain/Integrase core domain